MISDDLRRQADLFIELNDLRPYIERPQGRGQSATSNLDKILNKTSVDLDEIID